MKFTLDQSITILLDISEDEGSRDDIAMDISKYDDPIVFDALLNVVENSSDSETVRYSCMESIAQIIDRNKLNKKNLDRLGVINITKSIEIIKHQRNDIYRDFELDKIKI